MDDKKPLIVQSDKTLLLEVDHPAFEEARNIIGQFAELEKSPEYLHTYRITPLSLWNAAASKLTAEKIIDALYKYSKYPVPQVVNAEVTRQLSRYGKLKLIRNDSGDLILNSEDSNYIKEIQRSRKIQPFIDGPKDEHNLYVKSDFRGHIKQALIRLGFPVEDLAGYDVGHSFDFKLRDTLDNGKEF